jgi:L433K/L422K family protein
VLAVQREPKRRNMKKVDSQAADDDIRPEYDFSGAVRGKYYERFRQGSNVVLLEPDVSAAFPNSASVNQALRTLMPVARKGRIMRCPSRPQRRPNKRMQLTRSAKAKRRGPRS